MRILFHTTFALIVLAGAAGAHAAFQWLETTDVPAFSLAVSNAPDDLTKSGEPGLREVSSP